MQNITTIGIDIAKNVFQIHGVNKEGKVVFQKRVSRAKFLDTMRAIPACLVGMEACGGANYWLRQLQSMGHDAKQMSPQHVKPYIGSMKNDYKDAAGICEAVGRPRMLFVPVKNMEQQEIQSIHRVRTRLIGSRTALSNQIRGILAEHGIVLAKGIHRVRNELMDQVEDGSNELTPILRELLVDLYEEFVALDARIKKYGAKIEFIFRKNKLCQRIEKIPGIGPISATAMIACVGDAKVFKNGRQMSAWLGLTPCQHSSGEKQKLLGVSKHGDNYMRYLLIHGARSVVKCCGKKQDALSQWVNDKVVRRGKNKAAVALANKMVRTVWALLAKEKEYLSLA